MKPLVLTERICLTGHVIAMAFGLVGLLIVLPHPEFIATLSPVGMRLFEWSMGQGGVGYIILGAIAVALYLNRILGLRACLTFFIPSVCLSLGSELLGTSTGFPFGAYHYLAGLGYKIAGLVPFTIPLSWFYMGVTCYLLARAGLEALKLDPRLAQWGGVAIGAVLLVAWDLVLDPAMSQTSLPFWLFDEVGEFFGMPYRNLSGWLATGAIFMSVGALLWRSHPLKLTRAQLTVPLVVYLVNFAFGAIITLTSLDHRFAIPTLLSVALGVGPALLCWWLAGSQPAETAPDATVGVPSLET